MCVFQSPPSFSELKITAGTSSFMSCIFSPHFTLCSLCVLHTVKRRLVDKKNFPGCTTKRPPLCLGIAAAPAAAAEAAGEQRQRQRGGKGSYCFVMHREAVNINNDREQCCCDEVVRAGCRFMCVQSSFNTSCWFQAKIFCNRIIHIYIYYLIA